MHDLQLTRQLRALSTVLILVSLGANNQKYKVSENQVSVPILSPSTHAPSSCPKTSGQVDGLGSEDVATETGSWVLGECVPGEWGCQRKLRNYFQEGRGPMRVGRQRWEKAGRTFFPW